MWKNNSVILNIALTLVSLIKEEDVFDADAMDLPPHLGYLFTHISRHYMEHKCKSKQTSS